MATTNLFETRDVVIEIGNRKVTGNLRIPNQSKAVVAFAHGSGSGKFSSRNQFVASELNDAGISTLLIDLLEQDEAEDRNNIFDIELLSGRLNAAAYWLDENPETRHLALGFFGASTGAAAALLAASLLTKKVGAIVSRGGRPDLAQDALEQVRSPTLLIVGGNDEVVLQLNQEAFERLHCQKELTIIPGATHLFPEPGAMSRVANLTRNWFLKHLIT